MPSRYWLLASALLVVAAAPKDQPLVLGGVEPGAWQLREMGGAARALCVTDPASLLQLQHGMANCSHLLIENQPRAATVHYTCPGAGHGRTILKLETPRSLVLQTQGIDHGEPFDQHYQVTRTGACEASPR